MGRRFLQGLVWFIILDLIDFDLVDIKIVIVAKCDFWATTVIRVRNKLFWMLLPSELRGILLNRIRPHEIRVNAVLVVKRYVLTLIGWATARIDEEARALLSQTRATLLGWKWRETIIFTNIRPAFPLDLFHDNVSLTAAFFLPFGVDVLEILIVFLFFTEKVRQLRLVPELTRLLG